MFLILKKPSIIALKTMKQTLFSFIPPVKSVLHCMLMNPRVQCMLMNPKVQCMLMNPRVQCMLTNPRVQCMLIIPRVQCMSINPQCKTKSSFRPATIAKLLIVFDIVIVIICKNCHNNSKFNKLSCKEQKL